MTTRSLLFAAIVLTLPHVGTAQVPAALRAASRARIVAIAQGDSATWDRLTSDSFTVFGLNNHIVTKRQRLATIKVGTPVPPQMPSYERFQRVGTAFVHRYRVGDLMIHEVWGHERSGWRVASLQVMVVDPDSAAVRQTIDSANASFAAAFNRGDAAALGAFYTDDAILMPVGMPAWVGRAAITQGFTGFLAQFTVSGARLTTQDLLINGDYVVEHGTYAMTLHPKSGTGPDIVDNGKFLTVWQRQDDGSWKLIRDSSNADRGAM